MATPLRALTPPAASFVPNKEYVAAGGFFSTQVGAALSSLFNDDAELIAGGDIYERMLTDPEVRKCHKVIKDGVLGDGVQFYPAVTDETSPDYDLAHEIAAFCQVSIGQLRRPFRETLDELIGDALAFGHKVAEITYKDWTDEQGKPRLVHDTIKVKPRNSTNFVIDPYMNVLGLQVTMFASATAGAGVIPREKFFIPTFNRKDEDPRGRSILRPAYNWWLAKRTGLPIFLKRIEKKSIPSVFGTTSQNEEPIVETEATDGSPAKQQTASEVMAAKLAALEGFSAAAFPYGADAKVLDASGNGTEFRLFFEQCNSEITTGILLQTLATREGKFGTRAQSRTHMDVMSLLVWHVKGVTAEAIREDVLKPWAYYNYGDDGVRLLPLVSLGDSERRDWALDATAAAALAPYLTDSQWDSITKQLGVAAPLEGEPRPSRAKSSPQPAAPAGEEVTA